MGCQPSHQSFIHMRVHKKGRLLDENCQLFSSSRAKNIQQVHRKSERTSRDTKNQKQRQLQLGLQSFVKTTGKPMSKKERKKFQKLLKMTINEQNFNEISVLECMYCKIPKFKDIHHYLENQELDGS